MDEYDLGHFSDSDDECEDEAVLPELSTSDAEDEESLRSIYERGCGCRKHCSKQFSFSVYRDIIFMCRELTSEQLDLVIIGELLSSSNSESAHTDYMFHGKPLCRETFCNMHGIYIYTVNFRYLEPPRE